MDFFFFFFFFYGELLRRFTWEAYFILNLFPKSLKTFYAKDLNGKLYMFAIMLQPC